MKVFRVEDTLQWLLDQLSHSVWMENDRREVVVSNQAASVILQNPKLLEEIRQKADINLDDPSMAGRSFSIETEDDRIWGKALAFQPSTAPNTQWRAYFVSSGKVENQAAGQFLGLVSHELRTPLISMVAFFQLLRDGQLDLSDRSAQLLLEAAWKNSQKLQRIVTDLVGLRDIFLDQKDWALQEYDPRRLIQVALRQVCDETNLDMDERFDFAGNVNLPTGLGDRDGLERALYALLETSHKLANPLKKVKIELSTETQEGRLLWKGKITCPMGTQFPQRLIQEPELLFKPFGLAQIEKLDIRSTEGMGVDGALADQIFRNGGGVCGARIHHQTKDPGVFSGELEFWFEMPLGGDQDDLMRILQRRMNQKFQSQRDISVIRVALKGDPEQLGNAVKNALFRSSDAVFAISGNEHAEAVVVMDDCLLGDRIKVEGRLRAELDKAFRASPEVGLKMGGATFPVEGRDAASLLDLARQRLG